ncbi:hypothetical protein PHYPSEUDO_000558 [Phytophthora pseudosyringae]|uniref:EF-hand domain-containing protein n=1 Tax=Phytophthora pseudosyringae TaxID=221518 RepID=A0A8T1VY01_9STRA|nr:hypothetical protein PHYPSEUDO_000558 [Phytophthora pseudosyringae]
MEERAPRPSCDSGDETTLTWQDRVRRGLTSGDVRVRLHTYSTLSLKCNESKETQKLVGQLFDNGVASRVAACPLLNVLFDDLRSTDRTLRIAAARVLCLMAYENLANQQLIVRSQADRDEEQVGVTVGWVHAFSVPQSLRDRYEAQCEDRGLLSTPSGLVHFVSNLVKDNYASIYSRIGRYYAGGCRDFLPLCWFHALVNDSSEATDMVDVPDPDENLVGFYLVPRQMQFPEQDEDFLQEILASVRTQDELSCLQQVHAAFQHVAFRANEANAATLKTALEGIVARLTASDEEEEAFIVNQRHCNVLRWLSASPERMVTWNELLVWCCTDINANEMLKRFGADACRVVGLAFRKLTLGAEGLQPQKDQATSYVWESTLVGALLDHPDLPHELKANIRNFPCGRITREKKPSSAADAAFERPWEYLLPLALTEIHPVSWGVFLSRWRQSADTKPHQEVPIYHQNERRHHSVGEAADPAVLVARKNALVTLAHNPRIFHSFRDLNQLRKQLPLISNRPPEVNEDDVDFSPSRLRSIKDNQLSEAEERELEEKRKLYRRLQQSTIDLDEVTRQRLEEKREARSKAHEKAAEKRKKAEQLAAQRRHELERTKRDRQVQVQERIRRKEHRWQIRSEVRHERHQRAQWWKQIQHEAGVARQEEFMQRLKEQNESELAMAHNACSKSEPTVTHLSTGALPQRPAVGPPTSERQVSCPRRPLSARTATDPQITRERAHVYGCAVTKVFAARRPQTARADFFSGTPSPRARQQPAGFRRRVRPASGGDSRNDALSESSTPAEPNTSAPRASGVANACETLVMANAAHEVAEQIAIPPVAGPAPEEEAVPPAVIMAQYLALEKEQRLKLHERYCVNRVSHKLTFAVLQQLTHEMRQDAAWHEFLTAAGGPPGTNTNKRNKSKREAKVTYTAFANVASQLGIAMPPKRLQAVARSLDPWKTGFVSWESFYTWWSSQ